MNKERIADTLKSLRQEKGVTVTEAAEGCGITVSALCNYEAGERIPRDEVKIAIAKYYKKSVATIFYT